MVKKIAKNFRYLNKMQMKLGATKTEPYLALCHILMLCPLGSPVYLLLITFHFTPPIRPYLRLRPSLALFAATGWWILCGHDTSPAHL